MSAAEKVKGFFKWDMSDIDDGFYRSEVQANRNVAITMFNCGIVLLIAFILNLVGVFEIPKSTMLYIFIMGEIEFMVPSIICFALKGRSKKGKLKWLLLVEFTIVIARFDSMLTFYVTLTLILPVLLSCRYYSFKFTASIGILGIILYSISSPLGAVLAYHDIGIFDCNVISVTTGSLVITQNGFTESVKQFYMENHTVGQYVLDCYRYSFLPKFLVYILVCYIAATSTMKGRNMINEQANIAKENARIESELNLAAEIQSNMLPKIFSNLSNDKYEIDLYASMNPAKEVGGDFYDFFKLNDHLLAVVIADVSGKGVPAALFMAVAKNFIKTYALSSEACEEVVNKTNNRLCEGNNANLFVTAWFGIIDLEKEKLSYVVAGHNPPLLKRNSGEFEYLKSRPGLVLAGLENVSYKHYDTEFHPGDYLFLYTDGVTEATDINNELYSEERLKDFLNKHHFANAKETLYNVKNDIDLFVKGREQFDDITMLMVSYKNKPQFMRKEFNAQREVLPEVIDFVEQELIKHETSMKDIYKINVSVEEIFVNIASYSYKDNNGKVIVELSFDEKNASITFIDEGMEFNPLLKKDPDTTLSADERGIGGLGIFMVKKSMDECYYKRSGGQNMLTIIKKIKE